MERRNSCFRSSSAVSYSRTWHLPTVGWIGRKSDHLILWCMAPLSRERESERSELCAASHWVSGTSEQENEKLTSGCPNTLRNPLPLCDSFEGHWTLCFKGSSGGELSKYVSETGRQGQMRRPREKEKSVCAFCVPILSDAFIVLWLGIAIKWKRIAALLLALCRYWQPDFIPRFLVLFCSVTWVAFFVHNEGVLPHLSLWKGLRWAELQRI